MSNLDKFRKLIDRATKLRRVSLVECDAKELRLMLKSAEELEYHIKESICMLNIYKYFQYDDLDALEEDLKCAVYEADIVEIKKRHRFVERNCDRADKLIKDLELCRDALNEFCAKMGNKLEVSV